MNASALVPRSSRPHRSLKDAYLKFHLTPQTIAAFSMQHVQEVLTLPAHRLTFMPNMPACMLGLMNRHNRIFWVVDLAQLLGISQLSYIQQYNLIMTQVGTIPLGLVVHRVEGTAWFSSDAIQSPIGQVHSALVPYLRGYVLQTQQQQQEAMLILDAEAIVQSPILLNH